MTAVFVAMIVGAGAGVAAASGLVAYAQSRWTARGRAATAPAQA